MGNLGRRFRGFWEKEVSMISMNVNGKRYDLAVSPDTPLLWVLRETLGLTGTKYGCGISGCGSCTVHVEGEAVRSCGVSVSSVEGKKITTIEGIGATRIGKVLQKAWIAEEVPQCGYCQPGFIMAAAALLAQKPKPTDEQIDGAITNLCRCGTYNRVRRAIHRAAGEMAKGGKR
jgi:isoquinoline 1-oxidoreductase alpha subunit